MSMCSLLAHVLKQRGPIPSARVSSAKTAAKYPYWGSVRYQIVLGSGGFPVNRAQEAAASTRRSYDLARRDCEDLCRREGRVYCAKIGLLTDIECAKVLESLGGYEECVKKWHQRRPNNPPFQSLANRFLRHLCKKAGILYHDKLWLHRRDRWICEASFEVAYIPYGDDRDVQRFRLEENQHRRRLIAKACGDRVIPEATRTLIQADDYGQLYEIRRDDPRSYSGVDVQRQVRVVCPSTGAVYWLPVSRRCQTAHEAVASTFGLTAHEYVLSAEA